MNHMIVATMIPVKMQSMSTTYKMKKIVWKNPKLKTNTNPSEVAGNGENLNLSEILKFHSNLPHKQNTKSTRKAGSSLANCDLVSEKRKIVSNWTILKWYTPTNLFYIQNCDKLSEVI